MSRIGNKPIPVTEGVTTRIETNAVIVSGPKGEERIVLPPRIDVSEKDGILTVARRGQSNTVSALHGLTRSLIANAVSGVSEGFTKTLEIQGVGYRAKLQGTTLVLTIGFSHLVEIAQPTGITFQIKGNKILVTGANRQYVGEVAAGIRRVRPPDAYKGKGIRYVGEQVRLKPGKAAKAATGAAGGA